jgi:multisubunit Na+/H+ antiporter MnhB subunit
MDMQTLSKALWISLVSTGLLLVIELALSGGFPQGVPWGVFVFLAAMSFIAASSLIQGFGRELKNRFVRLGSVLVGLFAALAWTTMFIDQLPCFLGGKGC